MDFSREFIALACEKGVLRFGSFVTKAGRNSPYFFNAGLFDDGVSFRALCGYYAHAIRDAGVACDMLFGPAYKGIPLVAGTAIRLAEDGVGLPFAFNRKEAKDHGEGGMLIGAPLAGRVLILDDVISAGTSVREAGRGRDCACPHGARQGRAVCSAGSAGDFLHPRDCGSDAR